MSKTGAKSLSMRKMEKNFIAVIEKGYYRKPYKMFDFSFWVKRLNDEIKELLNSDTYEEMLDELADLSNIIDYMFEYIVNQKENIK